MSVLDSLFGAKKFDEPCVMGDESIMSKKKHGTSEVPAQKDLRWNCDYDTADRVSFVLFAMKTQVVLVCSLLHFMLIIISFLP